VLILGWDLGLEWDSSNQNLHSENRELAKGVRLRMATDAVVRQVLRNLAYAGHRARTIRVQREAGSVWFSALIFRYPTEGRYSPLRPPLIPCRSVWPCPDRAAGNDVCFSQTHPLACREATIGLGAGSPFVVGFSYRWQLTIPHSNT
jgi:hypothetical protein